MSLFGSLPFLISGMLPRFESAFFEAVSGFTTTGASVTTIFNHQFHGVFFWRATTHWIGGMGVLVLTLALLPKLTGRTSHLVRAESPGPSLSKLVPKTGQTAKILYGIYFALTLLEFISLLLCGLNPYDAAVHAFATAGTGGQDIQEMEDLRRTGHQDPERLGTGQELHHGEHQPIHRISAARIPFDQAGQREEEMLRE